MNFRIADTFTDSLAKLTAQEQKAAKTTAFDLQMDPASPGLSFHKLDRAKDSNFWSVRVNADIRLIVHRTKASLLLVYVDHHDAAYKWAERRKIERHPTTGAMQLVVVRERVEEGPAFPVVPPVAPPEAPEATGPDGAGPETPAPGPAATSTSTSASASAGKQKPLFANLRKTELMAFGVPAEWVEDVRRATEDTLFDIAANLPQEAQEALLKLAVGETPEPPVATPEDADPFAHPDAQRRFRMLVDGEELRRALDFPWEKWAVFLHPDQHRLVDRRYGGPARISGSAGTGKTVVALHRAVHLARADGQARVLLTTFSKALANALSQKLGHLIDGDAAIADRIAVRPITGAAYDLYSDLFGHPNIAAPSLIRSLLAEAAAAVGGDRPFSEAFLLGEWREIVDAWQIADWEGYRDVARLGRKTRIGGKQRETLWAIFERVRDGLAARKATTWAGVFGRLAEHYRSGKPPPYTHAVVDEAQDLGVAEARFLAALVGDRPDGLFLAGDLGQRIFQQPFSLRALGIDVRGRSHTLRINYRTSQRIRAQADRLLPASIADVDGNTESRLGTVSVFDGPPPEIRVFDGADEEAEAVGRFLAARVAEGCAPHEIGVFVRTEGEIGRARKAVKAAGLTAVVLTDKVAWEADSVAIGTMHLAKGLEFRAVAVMACDDEVLPLQERIETVTDASDLEEVYDTERHLLYVACTRARDRLTISGVDPASEFLDDLHG